MALLRSTGQLTVKCLHLRIRHYSIRHLLLLLAADDNFMRDGMGEGREQHGEKCDDKMNVNVTEIG